MKYKCIIASILAMCICCSCGQSNNKNKEEVTTTSVGEMQRIEDTEDTSREDNSGASGDKEIVENEDNALKTKYNESGLAVKTITGITGIAFDIPKGYTYKESGDRYSVYVDDTKINVDYRKKIKIEDEDEEDSSDKEEMSEDESVLQCGLNYIFKDMTGLYAISQINSIETTDMYSINNVNMIDFKIDITKVFVDVNNKKKDPMEINGVVHLTVAKNNDGIYMMSYISEDESGGIHENILRNILASVRKNGNSDEAWKEAFYVQYLKSDKAEENVYHCRIVSKDLTNEDTTLLVEYKVAKKNKEEVHSIKVGKPEKYNQIYFDFDIEIEEEDFEYVEITGITYYNGWLENKIDMESEEFEELLNTKVE